jgi:hypothetical protein
VGTPSSEELAAVLQADHDRWIGSTFAELDQLVARLRSRPGDPNIEPIISNLQTFLETHVQHSEEEVVSQVLEEFLNLPLWKQRDQLFGLWVATQIAEAAGYHRLVFHPVNGGLRFRFAATHVATIRSEPPLYLFAELRTRATILFSKKRKRNIQPDWRIVREPVTERISQVLIVECKQYAKPSRKNFLEAAVDYAINSGNAEVILVNYGDMDADRLVSSVPGYLEEAWRKIGSRVTLLGSFRPAKSDVRERFRSLVARHVPAPLPSVLDGLAPPQEVAGEATFSLAWDDQAIDLDLHLIVSPAGDAAGHVFYGGLGSVATAPWIELLRDVKQGGQAPEVMRVGRWSDGRYELWVHNYTGGSGFPSSTTLTVQLNGSVVEVRPTDVRGAAWHALDIDGATRRMTIVNTMHSTLPAS